MKTKILKIKRVPYSRLTKSEMADYAEKTISVVEKHDPELASFNALFELLEEKKKDIALLRLDYGIDEQRLRVDKIKEDLNLAISALKLKVRIAKKRKGALEMHVLENPINNHLRYLYKCRNNHEYSQRIKGFIDLVETTLVVQEALEELGVFNEFDSICSAFHQLEYTLQNRIELLSKRPNFTTKLIVSEITDTANNLFDGIEASYLVGNLTRIEGDPEPENPVNFVSLIDELNQLTAMIRKAINLRDVINKRKRNGEPVGDLLTGEPEDETSSTCGNETPPENEPQGEKTDPPEGNFEDE